MSSETIPSQFIGNTGQILVDGPPWFTLGGVLMYVKLVSASEVILEPLEECKDANNPKTWIWGKDFRISIRRHPDHYAIIYQKESTRAVIKGTIILSGAELLALFGCASDYGPTLIPAGTVAKDTFGIDQIFPGGTTVSITKRGRYICFGGPSVTHDFGRTSPPVHLYVHALTEATIHKLVHDT